MIIYEYIDLFSNTHYSKQIKLTDSKFKFNKKLEVEEAKPNKNQKNVKILIDVNDSLYKKGIYNEGTILLEDYKEINVKNTDFFVFNWGLCKQNHLIYFDDKNKNILKNIFQNAINFIFLLNFFVPKLKSLLVYLTEFDDKIETGNAKLLYEIIIKIIQIIIDMFPFGISYNKKIDITNMDLYLDENNFKKNISSNPNLYYYTSKFGEKSNEVELDKKHIVGYILVSQDELKNLLIELKFQIANLKHIIALLKVNDFVQNIFLLKIANILAISESSNISIYEKDLNIFTGNVDTIVAHKQLYFENKQDILRDLLHILEKNNDVEKQNIVIKKLQEIVNTGEEITLPLYMKFINPFTLNIFNRFKTLNLMLKNFYIPYFYAECKKQIDKDKERCLLQKESTTESINVNAINDLNHVLELIKLVSIIILTICENILDIYFNFNVLNTKFDNFIMDHYEIEYILYVFSVIGIIITMQFFYKRSKLLFMIVFLMLLIHLFV